MHKRGFNRRMRGQKKRRHTHWNRPREQVEEVTHRHFHWTAKERRQLEFRAAVYEWMDDFARLPKKAKLFGLFAICAVVLPAFVVDNSRSYLMGIGLFMICGAFFVLGAHWKVVRDFGKDGISMSRRRFFVLLLAVFLLGAFAISAGFVLYVSWVFLSRLP